MPDSSFWSGINRKSLVWGWLVVGFTAWLLASRSLGDTDQGFIQGLAWRIFRGESVYTDFDYVRPPMSVWFHSLWFWAGAGWDLLLGRMVVVLQLAVMVWAQMRLLEELSDRLQSRLPLFLIFFFAALHNFPAMPWHTVDGLFWTSLGFRMMVQNRTLAIAGGTLLLWMAVLTKQSFFPVPIVGMAMLLLLFPKNWKRTLVLSGGIPVLAGALVWLLAPSFLPTMVAGMSGASSLSDLLQVGLVDYAAPLVIAAGVVGAREWLKRWRKGRFSEWLYPVLGFAILAFWIGKMGWTRDSVAPPWRFAHIFWWIGMWEAWQTFRRNRRLAIVWAALLALAWCSSISWGYATPVLCSVPVWWAIWRHIPRPTMMLPAAITLAAGLTLAGFLFPYREINHFSPAPEQLTEAYPRLRFITPGPEITGELMELDSARQQFPGTFTVLPNWPLIHCLTDTDNPLPVDWAHNAEMHIDSDSVRYIHAFNRCDVVFVDLDRMDRMEMDGKYGSALLRYLVSHGDQIWTGREFAAFRLR